MISSLSLGIVLTLFIYMLSKILAKRYPYLWLSPLIICPVTLVLFLSVFHVNYATYARGAHYISLLLDPATVAFAVPIYKNRALIKQYATAILGSLIIGVIIAFTSSYFLAKSLNFSSQMVHSMMPRSITTPIAMDLSTMLGGQPNLTAIFVIVTGLAGSIVGPLVIRFMRIRSASARGLLLGMGAHGCGTSTAFSIGELEGSFASVAMILAALVSIILSIFFF